MPDPYKTRQSLLMTLVQNKKAGAWEEFSGIYRPFIAILLHSLKISENEIEDITQNIMVKLWNKIHTFSLDGRCKFRTWLISVIRNTAYSHLKKINRQKDKEKTFSELPQNECYQHD